MNQELLNVLKKKAMGFTYTEETCEYEQSKGKPILFCGKRNRIYLKNGFLSVKPKQTGVEIKEISAFKSAKNLGNWVFHKKS